MHDERATASIEIVEVTPASAKPPRLDGGVALVVISMAQLLIVLDGTVANIALPHIGRELGMSGATLTWIISGYALVFGAFLLLGGRLGDRFGYRRIFSIGLIVIAAASLVAGLATNDLVLLASRSVHGLGAALAAPAALALIPTTFRPGPARTRAFGFYAAMSGAGSGAGLLLGGWLTSIDDFAGVDVDGWRLTFLINVPVALVVVLLARRSLQESHPRRTRVDIPGVLTSTIGLVGLVFGFTRAGEVEAGWADPWTILSIAGGALLLVAFAMIERRSTHPLLPLRILRSTHRAASLGVMFLAGGGGFAVFYFLTVFLQRVLGYSSLETGVAFLPFAVGIFVGASAAARLMLRFDTRWVAGAGALMAALSLIGLAQLSVGDSVMISVQAALDGTLGIAVNYWTDVFPFMIMMALGTGAIFASLTPIAILGVEPEDTGVASGALNTMQQIGGAIILAILSTVAVHESRTGASGLTAQQGLALPADPTRAEEIIFQATFAEGATNAFWVAATLMLASTVLIVTLIRVTRREIVAAQPARD